MADDLSTAPLAQSATALSPVDAYTPRDLTQAMEVATWIAESRIYPDINTPQKAFVIMLKGADMRIPMSVALSEIRPVEGRFSASAQLLESLALRDPQVEYFRMVSLDDNACTYVAKRRGDPEITHTFTVDDAAKAGLLDRGSTDEKKAKNNWNRWRRSLLRRACSRELARIVSPAATLGLTTPDEMPRAVDAVDSIAEPIDVTAAAETPDYAGDLAACHTTGEVHALVADWKNHGRLTDEINAAARARFRALREAETAAAATAE